MPELFEGEVKGVIVSGGSTVNKTGRFYLLV